MKSLLFISESVLDAQLLRLTLSSLSFKCRVQHIRQLDGNKTKKKTAYNLILINECLSDLPNKDSLSEKYAGPVYYLLNQKKASIKNFMVKPFDDDTLLKAIVKILRKK